MPKGVYKRKPSHLRSLSGRFFEKLPADLDPSKCWEWTACRDGFGYGMIFNGEKSTGKRSLRAHRVSLELATGQKIPDDMFVLHHCDNPPCCNPDHLYVGTQTENVRGRDERGRQRAPCGEAHGGVKVPNELVREAVAMVKSGMTQKAAAAAIQSKGYPCTQITVSQWIRGRCRQSAFQQQNDV